MGDFEGLRAAVAAGDGVVARFPGIVCVAQCPPDDDAHLRRLLDICRENAGGAPGRVLARRLAMWLGGTEGPPDTFRFGTVSATGDDGLAVFCFGAVSMVAEPGEAGGPGTTISGTDAAAWADRLLRRPDAPVLLVLDGTTVAPELPSSVHDLRSGVVPGSAVMLLGSDARLAAAPAEPADAVPAAAVSAEPVASGEPEQAESEAASSIGSDAAPSVEPDAAPSVEPDAAPSVEPDAASSVEPDAAPGVARDAEPPVTAVVPEDAADEPPTQLIPEAPPPSPHPGPSPRPPRRADPILAAPLAESRPPLEAGGPPGTPAPDEEPTSISTPQAQGYLCSRGHLNDPRSHFCVLCGIRMNERTGVLVIGARPPLGLLVFDDGSTYTVDAEYLVGRMPEVDDRVVSGTLRAISVEDHSGAVSRVHAEIRLRDWDVLLCDSGSRNGTHVAAPGDQAWTPLRPGESYRLTPGTRVRMGGRTFVFESPSGVR